MYIVPGIRPVPSDYKLCNWYTSIKACFQTYMFTYNLSDIWCNPDSYAHQIILSSTAVLGLMSLVCQALVHGTCTWHVIYAMWSFLFSFISQNRVDMPSLFFSDLIFPRSAPPTPFLCTVDSYPSTPFYQEIVYIFKVLVYKLKCTCS